MPNIAACIALSLAANIVVVVPYNGVSWHYTRLTFTSLISLDCQSLHHVAELIKLYLPVVVVINLFEEFAQCFVKLIFYSQGLLQLILRNCTASILVK